MYATAHTYMSRKKLQTHKTLLGKSLASLISCEDLSFAPETS
jgi:hypothetical protein